MDSIFTLFIFLYSHVIIIFLFIDSVKNNKWKASVITQLICLMFSVGAIFFYDSLPGTGKAPGLTYLDDFIFSLFASVTYFITLIVTLIKRFCIKVHNYEI